MNEITSFKTLLGSLSKKLNKASIYGKLDLKTLYILDIVNELLYECPTCYNEKVKNKLQELVIKLQHLDKDICIYREERNLYTNIIGFKNCNPNNSSLQVINTPPKIDDPDPIEPIPEPVEPPTTCTQRVTSSNPVTLEVMNFKTIDKCFNDPNEGILTNVKITSLPQDGALSYNGILIELNQIISIDEISNIPFIYTPLIYPTEDTFTFQISASNYPNVYSVNYNAEIKMN